MSRIEFTQDELIALLHAITKANLADTDWDMYNALCDKIGKEISE